MNRRCENCAQEPSGLIPRQHEFCEFCGGKLLDPEPEKTKLKCYRCGKTFEGVAAVTTCADCQRLPPVEAPAPPDVPENNFASAAFSGVLFPVLVRVIYALGSGGLASNEAKALDGVVAFFGALSVLAVIGLLLGLVTGAKYGKPSSADQWVAGLAMAGTTVLLWLLT